MVVLLSQIIIIVYIFNLACVLVATVVLSNTIYLSGYFRCLAIMYSINYIIYLLGSVGQLQNLRYLDLALNSQMTSLTPQLLSMPNLTRLNCSGCVSLTSPPYAVCVGGLHAIRQYYRDLRSGGHVEVSEAAVALVGRTLSGKTSLVKTLVGSDGKRKLTNRTADAVEDETTRVFNMEKLVVGDNVLQFIDFGGNEIYQSTYQFTLKQNCIPIVVVNLMEFETLYFEMNGNEAVRCTYFDWLSHLYLANPGLRAPKLVFTHRDAYSADGFEQLKRLFFFHTKSVFNLIQLEENSEWNYSSSFTRISHFQCQEMFQEQDIYVVGDEYEEVFDQLRSHIISDSKLVVKKVPTLWRKVAQTFNSFHGSYKTFPEVLQLVFGYELANEDQLRVILSYMHNSGHLIWYQDRESLQSLVFYDISVVTKLLHVVFTHEKELWSNRRSAIEADSLDNPLIENETEFNNLAQEFVRTGEMSEKLFQHLLITETSFTTSDKIKVAVALLQSFQLLFKMKDSSQKLSYTMPYFSQEYFTDLTASRRQPVKLSVDMLFGGLTPPQYVYHQISVKLLNDLQDCSEKAVRKNGVELRDEAYTLQLLHDYKSRKLSISVTSGCRRVGNAWKMLTTSVHSTIKYVNSTWRASKITCINLCAHCPLVGEKRPKRFINPSWCQPSEYGESLPMTSDSSPGRCGTYRDVPACLLHPTFQLLGDELQKLSDFVKTNFKPPDNIGHSGAATHTVGTDDVLSDVSDEEEDTSSTSEDLTKLTLVPTTNQSIKSLFINTSKEILECIQSETRDEIHNTYGMFFLFLFAHGANGMIHGVDSQPVYLTQIYSLINSTNFPNMAGKPKVVVIQACRVGNSVSQTEQNIQQSTNSSSPELSAFRTHQQEAETSTGQRNFDVDDLLILHSCFERLA
ncbi:hypothetical protein EB796_002463 [Bugula neritina]|uniref:Caspase family p20 domain-containing protein n=1 Tax=Bugula neritina TaxID=10212 RepID=A0A7J7KM42_BUGNE|nr:hypothetical protein EB796_002463 [Bugula neritina]